MSKWHIEQRREDPTSQDITTFLCHKDRGDIMSDCLLEYEDRKPFFDAGPCGSIVIGGLGLGIIIEELLDEECVNDISVIEIDQEVIDLISYKFEDEDRVTIYKGDARNFDISQLSNMPDFVYLDIWDDDLGTSYQDRLDAFNYWMQQCEKCSNNKTVFVWAFDRSKRHAEKRVARNHK